MNLDELQSVQSRERQTDSLQQLRATFYEDAAAFIQELREERSKAAEIANDPFDSPDVNRLSDDIRTAEQTVEAIYERRVGKVVKMASLAAADMPTEQDGLTNEEQELFETMVAAIEDHRGRILNVLGGDAPAGTVSSPPPGGTGAGDHTGGDEDDDAVDAAALMGEDGVDGPPSAGTDSDDTSDSEPPAPAAPPDDPPGEGTPASGTDDGTTSTGPAEEGESGAEPADEPGGMGEADSADADSTERIRVRITEDVGEIFGVDEREYDLAKEDVVTLPATNAEPLIDRNAAEPLE